MQKIWEKVVLQSGRNGLRMPDALLARATTLHCVHSDKRTRTDLSRLTNF